MRSFSPFPGLSLLIAAGAGAFAGACSGTGPDVPKTHASATASAGKPLVDACEGSPPPPKQYTGPLKKARCKQEMFLTMAGVADDLGVKCGFCHVPKPDDERSFNYEPMTPKKEVALWMSHTFMDNLKRKDGAEMTCGSCHVDKAGKAAAKFLGEPRDIAWSVEWMTTVMTTRFVNLDGSKLKCKHCHVGTWGTPQFEKTVILKTEQVPHAVMPSAAPPAEPPPASSEPSAAPPASVAPSASAPSANPPAPSAKPPASATPPAKP